MYMEHLCNIIYITVHKNKEEEKVKEMRNWNFFEGIFIGPNADKNNNSIP